MDARRLDFVGRFLYFLVLVGFVLVVRVGIRRVKAARATWDRAARSLGMTATQGGFFTKPKIAGTQGGFDAEIDTFTQGSGNSSKTFTRYRVYYQPLGLGMKVTPQHALHRISKFFGAQDVEVGSRSFDDALIIKAHDSDAVASFLTPSRRTGLLRLFSNFRQATVDDEAITVVTSGLEGNEQKLVSTLRRVVAAARRLHDLDEDDDSVGRLLERRLSGELTQSSEEVRAVVHSHPDDLDGRLLELETLATAGKRQEAATALGELEAMLPADPEVEGWREYLEKPVPPQPPPTPVAGIEDDRFFEALFAANSLSFETTRLFEERYQGRSVTWTGRVKSWRRFDHDHDFGPGPGAKAVITVATIEHDLYGQTEIDAVVQLPASAASLSRGDTATVTGLLLRVDPLVRNVYVTGGRLL